MRKKAIKATAIELPEFKYRYYDSSELPEDDKSIYNPGAMEEYTQKGMELLDEIALRVENNLASIFQLESVYPENVSDSVRYQNDHMELTFIRNDCYGEDTVLWFEPKGEVDITTEVENGMVKLQELNPKLDFKLIYPVKPVEPPVVVPKPYVPPKPSAPVKALSMDEQIEIFIVNYIHEESKPTPFNWSNKKKAVSFSDICGAGAKHFNISAAYIAYPLEAGNGTKWNIFGETGYQMVSLIEQPKKKPVVPKKSPKAKQAVETPVRAKRTTKPKKEIEMEPKNEIVESRKSEGVDWWTVEDVVKYLGVTAITINRWTTRKGFPAHKISGRVVRYTRAEIDAWVMSKKA
jgi:excisionase family DNA binding protein